jgi:hypothetical protein
VDTWSSLPAAAAASFCSISTASSRMFFLYDPLLSHGRVDVRV